MRRQHGGWAGWYFKQLSVSVKPHTGRDKVFIGSYTLVGGLRRRYVNLLKELNTYHRDITFKAPLTNNLLFKVYDNFALDPILHERYDSAYLKNLNYVRLITSRSLRGRLLSRLHASYGQSNWHGAKSPKKLNMFVHNFAMAFEKDLFKRAVIKRYWLGVSRKGWTKDKEMRLKSKINKRRRVKAGKKFKRFGERQLAKLKKRKSLWK